MSFIARVVALCLALCAIYIAPASAQGAADLFTVSGVRVDVTAPDARQAQAQGFAQAQQLGFARIATRITTAAERARIGIPQIEGAALDRMVGGIDIEEARRSGTRYIARLGVRFDPNQVRAVLRQAGFNLIETRGAGLDVSPQYSGADAQAGALWLQAWEQGGFDRELQPLRVAAAAPPGAPPASGPLVIAIARASGANVVADLSRLEPDGRSTSLGQVSTPAGGATPTADAFARLAAAANEKIQASWKDRPIAPPAETTRLVASALYRNLSEWTRLKQGLETAAGSLISEIRIEAISGSGALVSFATAYSQDELASRLKEQGLLLAQTQYGPTLRVGAR